MSSIAFFPFLAPIALVAVAVLAGRRPGLRPSLVLSVSRVVTIGVVGLSLLAALTVATYGATDSPTVGLGAFGFSLRLDALSAVMFWLVAVVGALIVQYSRNYLDGDPDQGRFVGGLCLTMAAVLMLVLAGNLFQLVAAWIGTSLALHRLLVFYSARPAALAAARKKFIVARLGDVFLVSAALLLADAFGTGQLTGLFEAAREARAGGGLPAGASLATILIVLAAALKSAMFPTHGWLLEVMETPTPVSALLHAGLINAGTFLVVRLGEVVVLSPAALVLLMLIGGFTALLASVAMITQSSVKVSLAYSSAAHMGFMLLLCGLGAHAAAILHLVAHSFYKAHAFLSAGSVVDYVRATGAHGMEPELSPSRVVLSLAGAAVIYLALAYFLGMPIATRPGALALGAVFVIAIAHLVGQSLANQPLPYVVGRTAVAAALVTLAFFTLEAASHWMLAAATASVPATGHGEMLVMALVVAAFGAVTLLQTMLPQRASSPVWRAAYVHLKNGLYANALFDRMVGTLR
jgi:NAD(P)H-quinone oxidoreductase subunit 5